MSIEPPEQSTPQPDSEHDDQHGTVERGIPDVAPTVAWPPHVPRPDDDAELAAVEAGGRPAGDHEVEGPNSV